MLLLRETIEGAVEKAISAEAPFCNVSMPFGKQAAEKMNPSVLNRSLAEWRAVFYLHGIRVRLISNKAGIKGRE
ncbi:hypothetical protein AT864_02705 [Anoxybacillus sp. P3H1B]|uniref:hypothetical protein n=1 Tax=Anoxybacillus sp. P3H1B TaxID=1769293 RepID=UPI0007973C32|nr:hypothetical protein [Anoxybacillus sp. P3H1B]KXG09021.1 hypothetical protein AT864_02705 [Anoxybacillus sp. P3H1B]